MELRSRWMPTNDKELNVREAVAAVGQGGQHSVPFLFSFLFCHVHHRKDSQTRWWTMTKEKEKRCGC
jgi:hypothetical protein